MDSLKQLIDEFMAFRARVMPIVQAIEDGRLSLGAASLPAAVATMHLTVDQCLQAGDLDAAGAAAGLERAHGGAEDSHSFLRRILAHIHGAAKADLIAPMRSPDGGPMHEAQADESNDAAVGVAASADDAGAPADGDPNVAADPAPPEGQGDPIQDQPVHDQQQG
jgi:hypothetical protein